MLCVCIYISTGKNMTWHFGLLIHVDILNIWFLDTCGHPEHSVCWYMWTSWTFFLLKNKVLFLSFIPVCISWTWSAQNPFSSAMGTSFKVHNLLCSVTYSELGRITTVHCGQFLFNFCIEEPVMIDTALFCISLLLTRVSHVAVLIHPLPTRWRHPNLGHWRSIKKSGHSPSSCRCI